MNNIVVTRPPCYPWPLLKWYLRAVQPVILVINTPNGATHVMTVFDYERLDELHRQGEI